MTELKPWRTLSSRITYEDQWLRLRADRCETSDGKVIDPFHIIDASDWVNVAALTDDGNVVLIREYRHGAEAITLGLPGGVCDREDDSPIVSAARELEEETGYTCRSFVPTGRAHANWADHSNEIHFFLGFGAELNGQTNLDENEEIEVELCPWPEFLEYDFSGPKHTHHAAALFFAERYFKRHPDRTPK
ncbi:MAG: NUDIX hydrolase [Pseudomonadota bacterium]